MGSMSLNQFTFSGNLGKDPDFSATQNGLFVCKFSVAINSWDSAKRTEKTIWMNVVAFDKLAETCEKFLSKGMKVIVSGRFDENSWVDNERNTRKSYSVIASQVIMTESKKEGARTNDQTGKYVDRSPVTSFDEDFMDSMDLSLPS